MIKPIRMLSLALVSTFLAACASSSRVQSDFDDDLDFSLYRTFDFSSPTEFEDRDLAGDLALYFSAAIMQVLQEKGLARHANPDLVISVSVDLEKVSRPPNRANSCPRYEDYNARKIDLRYGGINGKSRRTMCVYSEGEVAIELSDIARNQPFMTGVARVRLDENDRGTRLQMSVVHDVVTMFGDAPDRHDSATSSLNFD